MTNAQIIAQSFGYTAGSILIISNIFQIMQIYKTKNVIGLSIVYLSLIMIACSLYIASGVLLNVQYIYIVNSVLFVQLGIMLIFKIKFTDIKKNIPEAIKKGIITTLEV